MGNNKTSRWQGAPVSGTGRKSSIIAPVMFLAMLSLVLAVAVGLLIRKTVSTNDQRVLVAIENEHIERQKESLFAELQVLELTYDDLQASYGMLESEILVRKNEIAELKARVLLSDNRDSLLVCQQEVLALSIDLSDFQEKVSLLEAENKLLISENEQVRASLVDVTSESESLRKDKKLLEDRILSASRLGIFNVTITPMRVTRRSESESERARRVSKVSICFSVHENIFAEQGPHDIFFRVENPSKNLMTPTGPIPAAIDGAQVQVSMKHTINYNNKEENYCFDFFNDPGFSKGHYQLAIFSKDQELWQGMFELK
jgi:hypothetical protein